MDQFNTKKLKPDNSIFQALTLWAIFLVLAIILNAAIPFILGKDVKKWIIIFIITIFRQTVNLMKKRDETKSALENGAKELSSLKVSDVMNKEPLVLNEDATFEEVIASFVAHHKVNPIPIVDKNNRVVATFGEIYNP